MALLSYGISIAGKKSRSSFLFSIIIGDLSLPLFILTVLNNVSLCVYSDGKQYNRQPGQYHSKVAVKTFLSSSWRHLMWMNSIMQTWQGIAKSWLFSRSLSSYVESLRAISATLICWSQPIHSPTISSWRLWLISYSTIVPPGVLDINFFTGTLHWGQVFSTSLTHFLIQRMQYLCSQPSKEVKFWSWMVSKQIVQVSPC